MEAYEKAIYTIGELSKIVDIPISTLRFYDDERVLVPIKKDETTNYRFYSKCQVMQALFIKELRQLNFTLTDIRKIMKEDSLVLLKDMLLENMEIMRIKIEELQFYYEYSKERFNQVVNGLETMIQIECDTAYNQYEPEYRIRYFPKRWVVSIKTLFNICDGEKTIECYIKLNDLCKRNKLLINGSIMATFSEEKGGHLNKEEYVIEWFLPVQFNGTKYPFMKEFGDFWGISTTYIGFHTGLKKTYENILDRIENEEFKITGPPIEEYVIHFSHISDPKKDITNIIFPIEMDRLKKEDIFMRQKLLR